MSRDRRPWTPQKVRDRIRVGVIVRRLQDHALGKMQMGLSEIKAADILLRKCLPDLATLEATMLGAARAPLPFVLLASDLPPVADVAPRTADDGAPALLSDAIKTDIEAA